MDGGGEEGGEEEGGAGQGAGLVGFMIDRLMW